MNQCFLEEHRLRGLERTPWATALDDIGPEQTDCSSHRAGHYAASSAERDGHPLAAPSAPDLPHTSGADVRGLNAPYLRPHLSRREPTNPKVSYAHRRARPWLLSGAIGGRGRPWKRSSRPPPIASPAPQHHQVAFWPLVPEGQASSSRLPSSPSPLRPPTVGAYGKTSAVHLRP